MRMIAVFGTYVLKVATTDFISEAVLSDVYVSIVYSVLLLS